MILWGVPFPTHHSMKRTSLKNNAGKGGAVELGKDWEGVAKQGLGHFGLMHQRYPSTLRLLNRQTTSSADYRACQGGWVGRAGGLR